MCIDEMNSKVKILHVYKDFDVYNGLIESFFFLGRNYSRDKIIFSLCVFNYSGGKYGKKFEDTGCKLINLDCGGGFFGYIVSFQRLYNLLKYYKPDVVVTHDRRGNFIGVPVAKITKVPLIISSETTLNDSATTIIRRLRDRLFHPILTAIISLSDVFVTNSEAVKQQWSNDSKSLKFSVIYPPFNLEKYETAMQHKKADQKQPETFPTLGYVGRISEEKGLHYLVEALVKVKKRHPSVKLLVAGVGGFEEEVKGLVDKYGLADSVVFLGFQENAFEVMRRIHLLVVPSRTEGFGMAALEAMAMGVPVIASNVGGLKEIINEYVGRLITPSDVRTLSQEILSLLECPEEMRRMGECGRERAFKFFRPQLYTEKFEDLFESMLKIKQ